ncbi:MAG: hypothetical protein R3F43_03135 [bacterium]
MQGAGADLAEAIAHAADALASHPKNHGRRITDGRLKVDRVTGFVRVPGDHPVLVALSVNPGVEGLRRHDGETERLLLPDDLVKRQAFGVAPLVPGIQEMRLGLDAVSVLNRLGLRHGALERVRTEAFVEWQGAALPVGRSNTPAPGEGKAAWRTAAIEGGDFILRQIMEDGRFHYQYYPSPMATPPGTPAATACRATQGRCMRWPCCTARRGGPLQGWRRARHRLAQRADAGELRRPRPDLR